MIDIKIDEYEADNDYRSIRKFFPFKMKNMI
jgi:hypothetical protein